VTRFRIADCRFSIGATAIFVVALALSLVAAPLPAQAQQAGKVYRVGFLWDRPAVWPEAIEGFRRALRVLGWVEGQNIVVEYRWAGGRFDRLHEMAEDLVRLKVEVIVAPTPIYAGAAKQAASTVPIVFASHADPIGSGHVGSLARPGGNLTGISLRHPHRGDCPLAGASPGVHRPSGRVG